MTTIDFWLICTEGAAILLAAGSLWLLLRGRKSGSWPEPQAAAGVSDPRSNETLRQLIEEAQTLCNELLNPAGRNQPPAHARPGRGDEKIQQLSRLLNRVEEEPAPEPAVEKKDRYLAAIDLAEEGLPLPEIGKRLSLTKGEVQLLVDLRAYCLK